MLHQRIHLFRRTSAVSHAIQGLRVSGLPTNSRVPGTQSRWDSPDAYGKLDRMGIRPDTADIVDSVVHNFCILCHISAPILEVEDKDVGTRFLALSRNFRPLL